MAMRCRGSRGVRCSRGDLGRLDCGRWRWGLVIRFSLGLGLYRMGYWVCGSNGYWVVEKAYQIWVWVMSYRVMGYRDMSIG